MFERICCNHLVFLGVVTGLQGLSIHASEHLPRPSSWLKVTAPPHGAHGTAQLPWLIFAFSLWESMCSSVHIRAGEWRKGGHIDLAFIFYYSNCFTKLCWFPAAQTGWPARIHNALHLEPPTLLVTLALAYASGWYNCSACCLLESLYKNVHSMSIPIYESWKSLGFNGSSQVWRALWWYWGCARIELRAAFEVSVRATLGESLFMPAVLGPI